MPSRSRAVVVELSCLSLSGTSGLEGRDLFSSAMDMEAPAETQVTHSSRPIFGVSGPTAINKEELQVTHHRFGGLVVFSQSIFMYQEGGRDEHSVAATSIYCQ